MDGAQALRYARTRHQDDDYHRNQRQQLVLMALRDKPFRKPGRHPQIPGLIAALQTAGRTDLAPDEMAALACVGPRINQAAITTLQIDGSMMIPWTTPTSGA